MVQLYLPNGENLKMHPSLSGPYRPIYTNLFNSEPMQKLLLYTYYMQRLLLNAKVRFSLFLTSFFYDFLSFFYGFLLVFLRFLE